MKRFKLLLMFVLFTLLTFISNQAISENESEWTHATRGISSRYKGQNYVSNLRVEQYRKTPAWDPLNDEKEPLSPGKAVQLARSMLEEFVPKNERSNWALADITLSKFGSNAIYLISSDRNGYETSGKNKWFYTVLFLNKANQYNAINDSKVEANKEYFRIIVLMNGECIKPVIRD